MGNKTERENENNNNNNNDQTPQNREIDLTPDEIQNMMNEKADLEVQVSQLTLANNNLNEQLKIYQNNNYIIQNNLQKMNNFATMNMSQAYQQIMLLQNQNNNFQNQNKVLQNQNNTLLNKIKKLELDIKNMQNEYITMQFYLNKMQIMLLNQMQGNSMKNNINSMQSVNSTPINNNSNNNMSNNNSSNFKYQKPSNAMNIIFNVNNGMKCPVSVLPNHKLGNIFILALYQNGYSNFVNIKNFRFHYNTQEISNLFYDNKEVSSYHFNQGFPVIEVNGNF
jgi:hypothetical protein